MAFDKRRLREKILAERNNLPIGVIEESSDIIAAVLLELPEYGQSGLIFCYVDFGSEVRTNRLLERFISDGRRIAVPMIERDKNKRLMSACQIIEPSDLMPGSYGIREPDPVTAKRVSANDVDLAIVPGVVFDVKGNRIGYGAGYYDRFLGAEGVRCFKIGIAFDFQVVDFISADRFDIPMDAVITEKRVLRTSANAKEKVLYRK